MGDLEDFFWESWTSPGKRKSKKERKKERKNTTLRTDESAQKKKRKKKFKEAMGERKAKNKEKKKKKNGLSAEADDSFVFTQFDAKPAVTPAALNSNDELNPDHPTQDSKKKTKRKKKVAFDLPPGCIRVKRPKCSSFSLERPKESVLPEREAARDSESCPWVAGPTHDDESQCASEDINSQDLFITQKTFRASPFEPSSGEASEAWTQQDKLNTSEASSKHHGQASRQDSQVHQRHRKSNKDVEKTVRVFFTEEEEEKEVFNKACRRDNEAKLQTQMALSANLTEEKKESSPVHLKPGVNPYLSEPIGVNPSLDVAKKPSRTSSRQSMVSTFTQTENLFTTELSFYLNCHQKHKAATHFEDLTPLDLSLPQRARKDLGTTLSAKMSSSKSKGDNPEHPRLRPSRSPAMKDVAAKKEGSCSVSMRREDESTPSPRSESEPKSADMTTSSEDNEPPCRAGRLDLNQVRAVQTRLNESFFFKTKGEGQSPRPESPLMKLAQGRDVKSRKRH